MILERAKESIQARKQNRDSQRFEKTTYGKRIASLKNKYVGEKCFVIGNGPSLKPEDLDILQQQGICSFASNKIFNIFENTEWRPTFYASEDIIILRDIQNIISGIPAKYHFIPVNLNWYEGVDIQNADYFWMDYTSSMEETCGISLDAAHSIRCKGTVTITCIQLAIYMGFSEIYLLGVDHNYAKIIDSNGNIVEDKSVKDYFSDKYDQGIKNELTHDIGSTTLAFMDVEKASRKFGTFKVYNATRGGKLEVFERVDFDTLFNK